MRIKTKKLVTIVLAATMLLPLAALTACGDSSPAVLTLGGYSVSEAKYHYWASEAKGNYIYSYDDVVNTADYWQSEIREGVTVAEYLDDMTLVSVKTKLVCSKLFDDYRLSFTSDEKQSVVDYIDDLIIERADGSKNMMNTMLGEYGINTSILKDIYLEDAKISKVYDYLYGAGGPEVLTDEDYEKFYTENYVRFQMIYINNAYQYVTDEEGNRTTDDDGYYATEPLNDADKAKKDAEIKAVEDGLKNGEDFNTLYDKYSELKAYKNGYYYSAADSYSDMLYYRLVSACEGIEVGEWATVESDTGTCIIKRLELDSGAWAQSQNSDFFGTNADSFKELVQQTAFQKLLESYFDKIVVNEDIIKKYSVATVTPAYFG